MRTDDIDIVSGLDSEAEASQGPFDAPEAQDQGQGADPAPLALRDQISSALKAEADTPPAATQGDGRARLPNGQFAPKNTEGVDAQPQQGVENPAQVIAPPRSLAPADAQYFSTLPVETQQYIARTMGPLEEQAARLAGYSQLEQMIAPRRQGWALNGMSPEMAINQLFALSDYAANDPTGFIVQFAQARGINLEDVVFEPDPVDPQIADLQQQVQELQGYIQQSNQSQQQQQFDNNRNQVIAFASQVDANGKPLYPYFEELGNSIVPYVQMVRQSNPNMSVEATLKQAYESACWASPSIRAKLQQAQIDALNAQKLSEQVAEADRARRAGVSVRQGSPGNVSPTGVNTTLSLRDEIKRQFANAGA